MNRKKIWTHGCDACDMDVPVQYVPVFGYLCEHCRSPAGLKDLKKQMADDRRADNG